MHSTTAINTTMKGANTLINRCVYIDRGYEFNTIVDHGKRQVKVKPCCYAHWGLIPVDVKQPMQVFETNEAITNNPVIQWFRDINKTGTLPKTCKACTTLESQGGKSPRIAGNNDYDPEYDIFMLDVHTGNECNLACAMCNPYSSSLIAKESRKHTGSYVPKNWSIEMADEQDSAVTFEQVDQIMKKYTVQIVKFKGGEPLLKRNWINIKRGLEDGQYANTWLRMTTNGTNISKDVLDALSLAKKANISISVDGLGAVGEFIRWPQTAEKINQTLDNIANNPYKHITFNTTTIVNILNIGDIENINNKCKDVAKSVSFDFDIKPEGHPLDYRNIPPEIRKKIRNSIDPSIMYKGGNVPLRNFIDIEHNGYSNPEEVRRTLDWFEDHRGQDLIHVLHPEVYKWYESLHAY